MKFAAKLNALIVLIALGFLVVIGMLVFAIGAVNSVHDLELEMMSVVNRSYRLSLDTGNLIVSDDDLVDLYGTWQASEAAVEEAVSAVAAHPAQARLGSEAQRSVDRVNQYWSIARGRLDNVDATLEDVLALDDLPRQARTGLAPATAWLINQGGALEDETLQEVVLSLNSAQASLQLVNDTILGALVENVTEALGDVQSAIEQFQWRIVLIVVVVSFFVLLIGFSGAVLFARRLAARIQRVESVMSRVAERDLTVRVDERGKDEIGSLGDHLDEVLGVLNTFFDDVRSSIEGVNSLKDTIASSSEESAASLNEISKNIESLKSQGDQLDSSVGVSTDAVEEILTGMGDLGERVERQVAGVNQTASAIEEMNASIQSLTSLSNERLSLAEQLRTVVQTGGEKVKATNDIVRAISGEVGEVQDVIELINSISQQTDLLSMNAAIESAHAGEAGRGFGVVAEEIRKLAESTSENARRISTSLGSITSQIGEALEASNESAKSFEDVASHVQDFTDAMSRVSEGMREISDGSSEVLQAAHEVHGVTDEIRQSARTMNDRASNIQESMGGLRQVSTHVSSGLSEIDTGAREILEAVTSVSSAGNASRARIENLDRIVGTFEVDGPVRND